MWGGAAPRPGRGRGRWQLAAAAAPGVASEAAHPNGHVPRHRAHADAALSSGRALPPVVGPSAAVAQPASLRFALSWPCFGRKPASGWGARPAVLRYNGTEKYGPDRPETHEGKPLTPTMVPGLARVQSRRRSRQVRTTATVCLDTACVPGPAPVLLRSFQFSPAAVQRQATCAHSRTPVGACGSRSGRSGALRRAK